MFRPHGSYAELIRLAAEQPDPGKPHLPGTATGKSALTPGNARPYAPGRNGPFLGNGNHPVSYLQD